MAWVTEYDMTWRSPTTSGDLYIQRDGGSYISPLKLKHDSIEISRNLPDWESHIMRSNCSFTIVNDCSDFFELLPLMTIADGQYKIVIESGTETLFEGFLNCETVSQNMLHFSEIKLTASGLLDKLQYIHPTEIDTLQNMSLISLIDACLCLTGSNYDIYVNCSLFENSAYVSVTDTLFNKTGIYTEMFWENNRKNTFINMLKNLSNK
jgi:hypothetical protein